jgi:AbrB family looped-hinge helix DNA binding protein
MRIQIMVTVTVSPKFQVVIPKEVREKLDLQPGQKLQILQFSDRIEFVPIKDVREMRGFLKGIKTNIPREKDRT